MHYPFFYIHCDGDVFEKS